MPPCIIKKLMELRFIQQEILQQQYIERRNMYFYKNIYVVGNPQALHFKQVFKTLELMGNDWAKDCFACWIWIS